MAIKKVIPIIKIKMTKIKREKLILTMVNKSKYLNRKCISKDNTIISMVKTWGMGVKKNMKQVLENLLQKISFLYNSKCKG